MATWLEMEARIKELEHRNFLLEGAAKAADKLNTAVHRLLEQDLSDVGAPLGEALKVVEDANFAYGQVRWPAD